MAGCISARWQWYYTIKLPTQTLYPTQPQHRANTHFPTINKGCFIRDFYQHRVEKSDEALGTDYQLSNERSKQGHVQRFGLTFFIVTTGIELAQSLLSTFEIRDRCMEIFNSVFFFYLDCKC